MTIAVEWDVKHQNKHNLEWVDNQKIKCRLDIRPEVEQEFLSIMDMPAAMGNFLKTDCFILHVYITNVKLRVCILKSHSKCSKILNTYICPEEQISRFLGYLS